MISEEGLHLLDWPAQLAELKVRGGLQPQTSEEQEANQQTLRLPQRTSPTFLIYLFSDKVDNTHPFFTVLPQAIPMVSPLIQPSGLIQLVVCSMTWSFSICHTYQESIVTRCVK